MSVIEVVLLQWPVNFCLFIQTKSVVTMCKNLLITLFIVLALCKYALDWSQWVYFFVTVESSLKKYLLGNSVIILLKSCEASEVSTCQSSECVKRNVILSTLLIDGILIEARNRNESRCYNFTWLGSRFHNGSVFMNATCRDSTRLATGIPCQQPLVVSCEWPSTYYLTCV